jgi:group I intron endonuclease
MKGYIYTIKNSVNGKVYVGSTVRPRKRGWEHFKALRAGMHCNKKLQNSWNKYGESAFKYAVVEELPNVDDLCKAEYGWMCELDSLKNGFNMLAPDAFFNSENLDVKRIKLKESIGKNFNIRPPSNLSKISKEEWIARRLEDPNYSCARYVKKTPPGKKQPRTNSKAVLQINQDGELVARHSSISDVLSLSQNAHQFIWKDLSRRPRHLTWQKCFWISEEAIA